MIANALRLEIDRYAGRMPKSNPLFYKAEDGTFTSSSLIAYLTNIRHLSFEAQAYLEVAGRRALARGDVPLADHYAHKRHEERGHEAWADRDLARVTAKVAEAPPAGILPSIHELIGFLGRTIEEDPALYLSYTLFSEYLIVLLGGRWLTLLEERCGVPRSSMTMVGNHIELDREHVQEALDEIDGLVGDPARLPRMREVLMETFAYFDRFCAEVTSDKALSGWTLADDTRHVSAA